MYFTSDSRNPARTIRSLLYVIQKWSRMASPMIPWMVIPVIALYLLSQLFPPELRIKITPLNLFSVLVQLIVLFWCEIFPKLSAWRVRKNAQRSEAIEMEKLEKINDGK